MNKDLIRLYKKANLLKQTPEIEIMKEEIETMLAEEMQENILKAASIGNVLGYERVKQYFTDALNMIELYENHNKKAE